MPDFGIEIKGDPTGISAFTFKSTVNDAVDLLKEYDSAISGVPRGTVGWYLADLSLRPNVLVAFNSRVLPPKRGKSFADHRKAITHSLLNGLDSLEHQAVTPEYISVGGMERVQRMVSLIGRNGATGFRVHADEDAIDLTVATGENIGKLLPVRRTAIGSVEGKLEGINLHRKLRVIVYHAITNRAVTCELADESVETAKEYLGRRVIVFGVLHKNANGETLKITVDRLVPAEKFLEQNRPTGVILDEPRFVGVSQSTRDYIRRIRGG
jgi:hypothetical protein